MMPIKAMQLRQTTLTEKVRVLFALTGAKGYMLRTDDKSTLFQLSSGTTPVISISDPVGYATDLSGNGNHFTQTTAGRRPTWNGAGVDFDGAGDGLSHTALDLSGSNYGYMAFTGQKVTGDNNACIMFHSAAPVGINGSIALWANGGSIVNFQYNARGITAQAQARLNHPSDVMASSLSAWNLTVGVDLDSQLDVWHNGVAQVVGTGSPTGIGTLTTQDHYIGSNGTGAQDFAGKGKRYATLGTTSPLTVAQINLLIAWIEEGRL